MGICLGGSLISFVEVTICVLMVPFRRFQENSVVTIESQNQLEKESRSQHQFKNIPSAKKLFRSVPLDKKLLKEWGEQKNSIFIIAGNFNIPKKQRQSKRNSKNFFSESVELFPTYFS